MNINWKLRLQNKTTLVALGVLVISFVYQLLGMVGIVPTVQQGVVENLFDMVVKILCLLGIVVDPTTTGINDSIQAMNYATPRGE